MANWARGLASGFETGVRVGDLLEQRRQREELAKAYGLTPQEQQAAVATPEQLARAQAETQGLQRQDIAEFGLTPEEAQRYAPTMPTEGQRVAPSTYTLGGVSFQRPPTQQEIDAARARAAADVYGRFGDAARREEIMRGLRAEERATAAEARAQRGFETQQQAAGLSIEAAQRKAQEDQNVQAARQEMATMRKAGPLTAAMIQEVSGKYQLDPTQFLRAEDAASTLEIKDTKRALSQAALKGEAGLNQFLADRFDPDKSDNITPKITKDRQGNLVVMYGDQVLQEYGAHKNVMSLVGSVIDMIDQNPFNTLKTLSELDYRSAATSAQRALSGRYERLGAEESKRMSPAQVKELNDLSIKISEAEDAGKSKDADKLRRQWERTYITAAGTMGKVVQPKAAGLVREMSDVDKENLRAFRAWETSTGRRASPGARDKKAAELGVTEFVNRSPAAPRAGLGSNPYGAEEE